MTQFTRAIALSERMRIEGSVAQSVEQFPLKEAVVGSNPTGPTMNQSHSATRFMVGMHRALLWCISTLAPVAQLD